MNMHFKITIIAVLILSLGLVSFYFYKSSRPAANPQVPTIRLGLATIPATGLLWVAYDKGYFTDAGLNVDVKEFTAGKFALQALIGGSLDLIAPAELPITLAALNGEKISILSQVNETLGGFPMILRKDGNDFDMIKYFSKKRRIGTVIGGGPEFFTYDFFKKYNINSQNYELINMKPEDAPIALATGNVDGVAIFEPFAHFAIERAGANNIVAVSTSSLYSETIVLSAKTDWAHSHTQEITKFIAALIKTQDFIKQNPQKSIEIISRRTKLDIETLKSIWPSFTFELGLKKKLIDTMKHETEWAKETNKLKSDAQNLNFDQLIFTEPLKQVSPGLVDL